MTSMLPARARSWLGPPFIAPEGQSATFVELFFDLVFVFAVTEVTALTLGDLDWENAARSALLFWMIWWAWTQWTWVLNPADTEHGVVRLGTLVATAIAFLMAASLHDAFGDDGGLWFAVPYVAVRVLGLALYLTVVAEHPELRAAVRGFATASIAGMIVVLVGGVVDPDYRAWVWLAATALDVAASVVAGRWEWRLYVEHFAERHGLFVIIALGESLIVVGLSIAEAERDADLVAVAIGAVAVTCLLWWSYFGWLKDALEARFERTPPERLGPFARDVYSLLHFPLIGGVIGIAVGFEEMALHPAEQLETGALVALAAGLALFVGFAGIAWARASGRLLLPRFALVAVLLVALVVAADARPAVLLAVIAAPLLAITAIELAAPSARRGVE